MTGKEDFVNNLKISRDINFKQLERKCVKAYNTKVTPIEEIAKTMPLFGFNPVVGVLVHSKEEIDKVKELLCPKGLVEIIPQIVDDIEEAKLFKVVDLKEWQEIIKPLTMSIIKYTGGTNTGVTIDKIKEQLNNSPEDTAFGIYVTQEELKEEIRMAVGGLRTLYVYVDEEPATDCKKVDTLVSELKRTKEYEETVDNLWRVESCNLSSCVIEEFRRLCKERLVEEPDSAWSKRFNFELEKGIISKHITDDLDTTEVSKAVRLGVVEKAIEHNRKLLEEMLKEIKDFNGVEDSFKSTRGEANSDKELTSTKESVMDKIARKRAERNK